MLCPLLLLLAHSRLSEPMQIQCYPLNREHEVIFVSRRMQTRYIILNKHMTIMIDYEVKNVPIFYVTQIGMKNMNGSLNIRGWIFKHKGKNVFMFFWPKKLFRMTFQSPELCWRHFKLISREVCNDVTDMAHAQYDNCNWVKSPPPQYSLATLVQQLNIRSELFLRNVESIPVDRETESDEHLCQSSWELWHKCSLWSTCGWDQPHVVTKVLKHWLKSSAKNSLAKYTSHCIKSQHHVILCRLH